MNAKTKITTGKVRFSFVNIFKPKSMDGSEENKKYSITLLIPKKDKITLQKIKTAISEAKQNYLKNNSGKKLPANLKTTLHDGDGQRPGGEDFGPECAGHYVITVSSKEQPAIVDEDRVDILDPTEVYSGCYGKAVINFFVYDTNGNRGVTAALLGVMKLSDGEPLSARVVTDADWDDDFEDYDEDDDEDEDDLGGMLA